MKLDLAIPRDWVTVRAVRDGREVLHVDGGLELEIDEPKAKQPDRDSAAILEAIAARDPVEGTTLERAGHVVAHTTEGVPLSLSSLKFRDATNAVVEGRLIAFYDFGDYTATVCCRLPGREALARFGPAIEPLLATARLDREPAPRIDDLLQ